VYAGRERGGREVLEPRFESPPRDRRFGRPRDCMVLRVGGSFGRGQCGFLVDSVI
jgi:hypothetical protein